MKELSIIESNVSYLHFIITGIMIIIPLLLTSCTQVKPGDHLINISGKWKITDYDNRDMARSDYDDSKADEITIPGSWNNMLNKNDDLAVTIWLR